MLYKIAENRIFRYKKYKMLGKIKQDFTAKFIQDQTYRAY